MFLIPSVASTRNA